MIYVIVAQVKNIKNVVLTNNKRLKMIRITMENVDKYVSDNSLKNDIVIYLDDNPINNISRLVWAYNEEDNRLYRNHEIQGKLKSDWSLVEA